MKTRLECISEGVNLLTVSGIKLGDLDEVDSWLFAIDMAQADRRAACRQIMTEGSYAVSNIEHRVTVLFKL